MAETLTQYPIRNGSTVYYRRERDGKVIRGTAVKMGITSSGEVQFLVESLGTQERVWVKENQLC